MRLNALTPRKILSLLADVWLAAIQNLPGPLGYKLRYQFWRTRLKYLGNQVRIDCNVLFQNPSFISIDDNCWIDRNVMILAGIDNSTRTKRYCKENTSIARGNVAIGKNVHIGPFCVISGIDGGVMICDDCGISSGVKIYAFTHHYRFEDRPYDARCSFGPMVDHERQSMIVGSVMLHENVGVALNTIILPGVVIGKNSFVAVGSLLFDKEYSDNSLISGVPAKRKKDRFEVR